MTLQQAKDEVAKEWFSKNDTSHWKRSPSLDNTPLWKNLMFEVKLNLMDTVCELYARSKWDEAVDEQRLLLSRLFDAAGGTLSGYYTMKELKRPPFNP